MLDRSWNDRVRPCQCEVEKLGCLGLGNDRVLEAGIDDAVAICVGKAANSAVCYVLGITSIDPVRTELLFERFVSAERREPPDIDVDFEHERREEVIQWIYETYGRTKSALDVTPVFSSTWS